MEKLSLLLETEKNKIEKLLKNQKNFKKNDGCYVYELEADVTIPSEYILLMHFKGKIEINIEKKIANYIISRQNKEGGWPLFHNGETDLSASVKAYYALKLSGLSENSKILLKAKECIIKNGGASNVNVFTKITLALFNQISWELIPFMPIEIIKFPKWFPFHIYKISYWSRTVLIPLLIIMHEKPIASNPNAIVIDELFIKKGKIKKLKKKFNQSFLSGLFLFLEKLSKLIFPLLPKKIKEESKKDIINWIKPRLNGEDGLGGIFPAMVNALIAFKTLDETKFKSEISTIQKIISGTSFEISDKNLYVDKKYFDKVIYTDISKDGTLTGVNIEQTKKFAKSIEIPIIASGGISDINNVKDLYNQKDIGISGVIIGKAIYEKKFDLKNLAKLLGN